MSGESGTIVGFNAARVVFGPGASGETGEHLRLLGVTRALVVCDRFVTESGLGQRLQASLREAGVDSVVYDRIVGEPSETSVAEAIEAARGGYDGFVGIGGGSALDTAKLCALFATHEGELLDYVNAPIGAGRPVPGPVLPIVALPTTSGTGSEVTTVAIVDFPRLGTKTGISHQHLRPSLAIVDPLLTVSCPPGVTASTGIDALMHALEAYTVSSYDTRPHLPLGERPPYQGANPFSDPLCERAIELVGRSLRTAVSDGSDVEARTAMALASTIAGIAFSGAGVHIPHALAYPIASHKHEWRPPGYGGAALVPHGFAVAVTAPAVFRFIADAMPERCAAAARLLDGGDDLAGSLERLMEDIGAPTRLGEIGYGEDDLAALVPGALDQRRLLVGSPKEVGAAELDGVLRASL
jgi:hydroxyacid-oxoacid transhydrogenase